VAGTTLKGRALGSRKGRTLLALLAAERGRLLPVDWFVDELRPAAPPTAPPTDAAANVSTLVTYLCVPNALSQPGGYALGAQAGEAAIRQVVTDAGLTRFRRVAQTPFNAVYETRR
jgi:hypothetical protein